MYINFRIHEKKIILLVFFAFTFLYYKPTITLSDQHIPPPQEQQPTEPGTIEYPLPTKSPSTQDTDIKLPQKEFPTKYKYDVPQKPPSTKDQKDIEIQKQPGTQLDHPIPVDPGIRIPEKYLPPKTPEEPGIPPMTPPGEEDDYIEIQQDPKAGEGEKPPPTKTRPRKPKPTPTPGEKPPPTTGVKVPPTEPQAPGSTNFCKDEKGKTYKNGESRDLKKKEKIWTDVFDDNKTAKIHIKYTPVLPRGSKEAKKGAKALSDVTDFISDVLGTVSKATAGRLEFLVAYLKVETDAANAAINNGLRRNKQLSTAFVNLTVMWPTQEIHGHCIPTVKCNNGKWEPTGIRWVEKTTVDTRPESDTKDRIKFKDVHISKIGSKVFGSQNHPVVSKIKKNLEKFKKNRCMGVTHPISSKPSVIVPPPPKKVEPKNDCNKLKKEIERLKGELSKANTDLKIFQSNKQKELNKAKSDLNNAKVELKKAESAERVIVANILSIDRMNAAANITKKQYNKLKKKYNKELRAAKARVQAAKEAIEAANAIINSLNNKEFALQKKVNSINRKLQEKQREYNRKCKK